MRAAIIAFNYSKNLEYLSQKLLQQGIEIENCLIISQDMSKLEEAYKAATQKCNLVFFVGGIGISQSDIVKEFLSQRLRVNLMYSKKAQEYFNNYFTISGQSIPPIYAQEKLLNYPENFDTFPSIYGFEMPAIGKFGNLQIILLPENHEEIINVYETYLKKHFENFFDDKPAVAFFKVFGLRKDEIEDKVKELKRLGNCFSFNLNIDDALDTLVTIKFNKGTRKTTVDRVLPAIYDAFADEMYCDGNMGLEEVMLYLLESNSRKLGVAESITGGMLCSSIVSISGASKVFQEGCITYSNESKQMRLLVKPLTISQHGAVSSQAAYEMAVGLLNTTKSDTVLAVTGIAGPKGGNASKPVGRTYISVGDYKGIHVYEYTFSGARNQIRLKATKTAIYLLIKHLKKNR